ncbi:MAG: nucleotidyltransferase domain-containing protein [archaeon]
MIQKYSRYRILEVFFRTPRHIFHIREICRLVKLSQPTVKVHLNELVSEKLILKSTEGLYGGYKANRDNESFKLLKQQNTIFLLNQSGCINLIHEKIMPQTIILFGSSTKGEDIEESDIDLFVEGKEEELDLKKFEKLLNRNINILFEDDFKKLSKELKNNLINGIKLYGFLRAF